VSKKYRELSFESYRFLAMAKRSDTLKKRHFTEAIAGVVKSFSTLPPSLYNVTYQVIFDNRNTRTNHSRAYFDSVSYALRVYLGCEVEKKYYIKRGEYVDTDVETIEISKRLRPSESETLERILTIASEPVHFHFSPQTCLIVEEKGRVVDQLVTGSYRYYKFTTARWRIPYSIFTTPKVPYKDRTTYEFAKFFDVEDKENMKDVLYWFFDQYPAVLECLMKDAVGARMAYARLSPPGKKDHLHWRMKTEDLYDELYGDVFISTTSSDIIFELIKGEDACYFYPAVNKTVEIDGVPVSIRHKLIREYDSPAIVPQEITAKISDICHETIKNKGIQTLYAHSGSRSARDQCFLDISLLQRSRELADEFPIIGAAASSRPKRITDYYAAVLKALNNIIEINLIQRLYEEELLFRPMRRVKRRTLLGTETVALNAPYVTFNKISKYRPVSILIDMPSTDSIGIGSPKSRLMLKKWWRFLRKKEKDYREWRGYFTYLICRPIERCPKSREEIVEMCNMLTAGKFFESHNYEVMKRMENKLNAETVEKIFDRELSDRKDRRRFFDYCALKEENYLKKYYGLTV